MSNFFSEILQSIKKTSTDRISNPFYGVLIISWLAFNWEAVAILIFSDLKMEERVRFINSAYSLLNIYPFITAIILTFVLPWCTEKVTFFQSKPISRTSTLLAIRKKRMLLADISVERFRAKKDVAYERHKAGEEKQIQDMKAAIISSKETTGQLTAELESARDKIDNLGLEKRRLDVEIKDLKDILIEKDNRIKSLNSSISMIENERVSGLDEIKSLKEEKFKYEQFIEEKVRDVSNLQEIIQEKSNSFLRDINELKDIYSFNNDELYLQMKNKGLSDKEAIEKINRIKIIIDKYPLSIHMGRNQ
nr:hypothetical protein [Pantoea agglomerans]